MTPDEVVRELHDVRITLGKLNAVVTDQWHLIGSLNERVRFLEKDAMRRGSQVVTMRVVNPERTNGKETA